jgi:hypothetical protein
MNLFFIIILILIFLVSGNGMTIDQGREIIKLLKEIKELL